MNSNKLPDSTVGLISLATQAVSGCNGHEAEIGLHQNTETNVQIDLDATRAAVLVYDEATATKVAATAARNAADTAARACLAAVRAVLVLRYGAEWSDAWLPTGFPDGSNAIPDTVDARAELLFELHGYFTAHPAHENAPLGVTAALAQTNGDALSGGINMLAENIVIAGQKKVLRDAAVLALRKRLRGLINELEQLLDENDPRWIAFGLTPPGTPATPEIPVAPTLTAGTHGIVIASWPVATRADYYRVFKQVVGVDAAFVYVDHPSDTGLLLHGLPTGATVKVCLSAANSHGESQRSEVAQLVVP
ncbi:MAG: hypothetical protein RLZZ350_2443 [Verrucomicrobiota bacterium]|jgi:hypothetical protein